MGCKGSPSGAGPWSLAGERRMEWRACYTQYSGHTSPPPPCHGLLGRVSCRHPLEVRPTAVILLGTQDRGLCEEVTRSLSPTALHKGGTPAPTRSPREYLPGSLASAQRSDSLTLRFQECLFKLTERATHVRGCSGTATAPGRKADVWHSPEREPWSEEVDRWRWRWQETECA